MQCVKLLKFQGVLHVNIWGQRCLAGKKRSYSHKNNSSKCDIFNGGTMVTMIHFYKEDHEKSKYQIPRWLTVIQIFSLALGLWLMINGCDPILEPTFSTSEEHYGGTWAHGMKFNEGGASGVQSYLLSLHDPKESSHPLFYNTEETQTSCPERTEVRLF